jgi:hypothetical protein
MAFTSSVTQRDIWGSMAVSIGTFTNDGETGGDIATGLNRCYGLILQPGGAGVAGVADNACVVNETFTANGLDGSAITIVTGDNVDGNWLAFGDQHT